MKKKPQYHAEKKSPFGKLQVLDSSFQGEPVRFLMVDRHMESAMYLDPERKNELVFPYMRYFGYALAVRPELKTTLLIGGGAFCYPKYYVMHYPDKSIDAIEISDDVIDLARTWFDLDEALEKAGDRMKILHMDGMEYLSNNHRRYDIIINDAFIGSKPLGYSEEAIALIHSNLSENGIYIVNAVTAAGGILGRRGRQLNAMLKKVFRNTMMILCDDEEDLYRRQNILFLASDGMLDLYPDNENEEEEL